MAWFRKKSDPITDRARALNEEIAQLEAQIRKLDARVQNQPSPPRLRTTAVPYGAALNQPANGVAPAALVAHEPVFEQVTQVQDPAQSAAPAEPTNDLGVRKYDLAAFVRRLRNHFRGPSTTNPKLVSYLAAGGIQGLRPMRYEKRVARNRFIALVITLLVFLLGMVAVYLRRR